ncbi:hypothetical protein RO3G_11491 [Rhizopus delemar RA 99-880]|uniref:Uncharacterized protein n=1 Tax=Rhizopus delemar (strain RA 99-880 / ATCC MYA-4621 / FGSC 9543 / NRRL 43880) TaxID=246409 RepID=I1CEA0_RHIO9|nr:hypothetical protein RO3G_11491 [Rhizopus delemar RA 99-880]|eukprot:EIE86780.1 hypothetical protein RO3G_11491 [Rhizopus delemar RA 99-880]
MYVMELASPKVYRMINVAQNVDFEVALKIVTAAVSSCATLKFPAICPPLYWLSNDSYVLSHPTKKQKK